VKKANTASLLSFVQLTERLIKEHGGFEACMKTIEAMKRQKADDEVNFGLSDLNEGLRQDFTDDEGDDNSSEDGRSTDSFSQFLDLLPISSAKVHLFTSLSHILLLVWFGLVWFGSVQWLMLLGYHSIFVWVGE
jgi:hypothetical protein